MKTKTELIPNVRVDPELADQLRAEAVKRDRSLSYIVREALSQYAELKLKNGE